MPSCRSRGILDRMQIEDVKPSKPNFGVVVVMFAATILVIAIAAVAIVTWRAHQATKTPYTKHPLSRLAMPNGPGVTRA